MSGFVMILYKMRNTFIAAAMLNAINSINTASEPSTASIAPSASNISMMRLPPQAFFLIISLSGKIVKKRRGGMPGVINVGKGRKQCFPLFPC